jgi:hypothetical protein
MKYLLESWKVYTEKLSKAEKKKRHLKRLHPAHQSPDDIIPPELDRLARGVISDANDMFDKEGRFSNNSTDGSYSSAGKQGERSGKKRGRSQSPCGRKKRPDGHKYKCKDGTLREDELEAPDDITGDVDRAYLKATVERAVSAAITKALRDVSKSSGCSFQQCLRLINAVNRSEDGKLYDKPKAKRK